MVQFDSSSSSSTPLLAPESRSPGQINAYGYLGNKRFSYSRAPSPAGSMDGEGSRGDGGGGLLPEYDGRKYTFPLANASRQKPRKWPLAFRFIKGAIHHVIILPIALHGLFTAGIVYLYQERNIDLSLPASIVPSLSIVVGLMLVFRNSSSYDRYWGGRTNLQSIVSVVRSLSRSFLIWGPNENPQDREETERVVKCLVAILFAVKNYLRGNWGIAGYDPSYAELIPAGLKGHESEGLGLPQELCFVVERYIKRGAVRGAFNAPQSAMLSGQVNTLICSFGTMETIKLTPIPVCHQIHQKQVLALYCCVLPFCLVKEMGWWCVVVIVMVCFTLYGIEGIGEELEDPFGEDKNDIKMDAVIEDIRREILVMVKGFRRGEEVYYRGDDKVAD
ncbi:Similar to UPF0187 protein alr2987; acc. no. Q8YSU5 [Pyronema omphalodes CBS 100304]|uniref:Similar to UPF0187 protein alr2987 acc. no. Q8YSU5 n=1 Tax=Pyronema omphalodes (strain CBS 100304) TaxID=1076935 RepID=U4L8X5_PYROM|nr:Similar to UPF0187 protein alr2987; acc. no. Q8YSU5 [Pyronema omphalodes CBS 100304]